MQLIDADAHVNPPPTFWDDYLPASLADRGPKIEEGKPGEAHDWVVFEGSRKPLNLLLDEWVVRSSGHLEVRQCP